MKPFDWSYTTDYKGTITKGRKFEIQKDNTDPIPIALLKRPDPILFFEEVVLYESELDDNGISIVSCKLRVMPDRMLLLCRLFMRLDQVLIRIRDTRIYVDFNTSKVIRDYTEKQDEFDKVKKVSQYCNLCFMTKPFVLIGLYFSSSKVKPSSTSCSILVSMVWNTTGFARPNSANYSFRVFCSREGCQQI